MIARECVGLWLKDHPHNDWACRIVRFDGETLVAYCGRQFLAKDAGRIVQGARLCPKCVELSRRRDLDHLKAALLHKFNDRRGYANH
jgi:hypothetical protein